MHEHSARRRAALSCRADGAKYDRRNRKIEVRKLINNNGVIAAKFEQELAHPCSDTCADFLADGR